MAALEKAHASKAQAAVNNSPANSLDIVQGEAGSSRAPSKGEAVITFPAKSFLDIVQGEAGSSRPPSKGFNGFDFSDPANVPHKPTSYHHGIPSIVFSESEKLQLVSKVKWVLLGKFSHGRPQLQVIQSFFKKLQLQGDVNCALFDSKHLFIECSCYVDYYWIWMQLVLNIQGYNMRLFKWEPNFSALVESSIAPVWIRIVGLALYLFDERTLLSIASCVGKPIKVDSRNLDRSCLSYARVCVELDASKPLIEEIDISIVDDVTGVVIDSKKAQIWYDVVPKFCINCSHIGHTSSACKRPGVAPKCASNTVESRHPKSVWKQVRRDGASSGQNLQQRTGQDLSSSEQNLQHGAGQEQIELHALLSSGQKLQTGLGQKSAGQNMQQDTEQVTVPQLTVGAAHLQQRDMEQTGLHILQQLGPRLEAAQNVDEQLGEPVEFKQDGITSRTDIVEGYSSLATQTLLQTVEHSASPLHKVDGRNLQPLTHDQSLQTSPASTPSKPDPIAKVNGTNLQRSRVLPTSDMVRPKSADSALGKKKLEAREISCNNIEQKRTKAITKSSWADEVEAMEEQESKPRMAVEHSVFDGKAYKEGIYKNYLVLNVPGYQEMSTLEQKETVACTMADLYQSMISYDIEEEVREEEVRQEMIIRDEPAPEQGWQIVSHKKKRNSTGKATSQEQDLGSKASSPPEINKDRQRNKERLLSPDPDYNMERLQARIRKMKRDSPQKRQLQAELKLLRGA